MLKYIETKFLVYYALILLCTIFSFRFFQKNHGLRPLFFLLPISLLTELLVEYRIQHKQSYYFIYHFYGLIDTFFFCLLFYRLANAELIRRIILVIFLLYAVIAVTLSTYYIPLTSYPSLQYALESVLMILLSVHYLLTMPAQEQIALWHRGDFWIVIGLLIFHSGILFINGTYNHLKALSPEHALDIKNWVNMIFNYLFYLSFIIAMICRIPIRKP